jgi:hypothetical protein
MRSRVVAAAIAAGLLQVHAARAQDPCAEDMKQFCADVRVGGGRVQDCLRKNAAKLSPACSAKRATADARFQSLVVEFSAMCRRDADRLCSEVKPGGGRVVACLIRDGRCVFLRLVSAGGVLAPRKPARATVQCAACKRFA